MTQREDWAIESNRVLLEARSLAVCAHSEATGCCMTRTRCRRAGSRRLQIVLSSSVSSGVQFGAHYGSTEGRWYQTWKQEGPLDHVFWINWLPYGATWMWSSQNKGVEWWPCWFHQAERVTSVMPNQDWLLHWPARTASLKDVLQTRETSRRLFKTGQDKSSNKTKNESFFEMALRR